MATAWDHSSSLTLLASFVFGIILVKAEVGSWFRIQEMFHIHGRSAGSHE